MVLKIFICVVLLTSAVCYGYPHGVNGNIAAGSNGEVTVTKVDPVPGSPGTNLVTVTSYLPTKDASGGYTVSQTVVSDAGLPAANVAYGAMRNMGRQFQKFQSSVPDTNVAVVGFGVSGGLGVGPQGATGFVETATVRI